MKLSELTDQQLWLLMRSRNKDALECLYRRYYAVLLTYGISFGYDEELVKDSIQDLFEEIYIAKNLPVVDYVKAYFFRALKNILYDKIQNISPMINIEECETDNLLLNDIELERLFSKEDIDLYHGRLLLTQYRLLSEKQKEIIYLHYIKELSWDEIAAVMEIAPHSCMNLLGRAIVKLRMLVDAARKNN